DARPLPGRQRSERAGHLQPVIGARGRVRAGRLVGARQADERQAQVLPKARPGEVDRHLVREVPGVILGVHVSPPFEQPGEGLLGEVLARARVPGDQRGRPRHSFEMRPEERVEVRCRLDLLVADPQGKHPPLHTRGHPKTYTRGSSAWNVTEGGPTNTEILPIPSRPQRCILAPYAEVVVSGLGPRERRTSWTPPSRSAVRWGGLARRSPRWGSEGPGRP